MNTAYDWITVLAFSGLIVLFLHRSDRPERPDDALWRYLLAGAGCAAVNWLGNGDHHLAAIAAGVALTAFVLFALKPFGKRR